MNDVRRFRIIGRTTDGRKWAAFVNFAPEFIEAAGLRSLMFVAMNATSWDEEHDCQTRSLEMEPFPEGEWERLEALVWEAEGLAAGQVWKDEDTDDEVTVLSVEDGLVSYAHRKDFCQSDVGTFLDCRYLVRDAVDPKG